MDFEINFVYLLQRPQLKRPQRQLNLLQVNYARLVIYIENDANILIKKKCNFTYKRNYSFLAATTESTTKDTTTGKLKAFLQFNNNSLCNALHNPVIDVCEF